MAKRKNPPRLAKEHAVTLANKIEWEGDLLYVMENWDFKEFHDKKFNSLRKAFIEAARKLKDYTGIEDIDLCEEADIPTLCGNCGDSLDEFGDCATCNSD